MAKLIIFSIILSSTSLSLAQPWSGTGEPNLPYLIYDVDDLQAIGADPNYWDYHYQLMDDIDLQTLSNNEYNIIGNYDIPFNGSFDGNGYTIKNFSWLSTDRDYIGIFGYVGGKVRNLYVGSVTIIAGDKDNAAGIAGMNGGQIENCHVTGDISGENFIAGIAGINLGSSSIVDCSFSGSVVGTNDCTGGLVGWNFVGDVEKCYAIGSVEGDFRTGGLVGCNFGGVVSNCYAKNSVFGVERAGGLIGSNELAVIYKCQASNCYSTGRTNGNIAVGGLIGFGDPNDVTNSFWDIEASERTSSQGGSAAYSADMKRKDTFLDAGWDFSTPIWEICDVTNYPRLNWQKPIPGDFICPDGVDFFDFSIIAQEWLSNRSLADLNNDNVVDLGDLMIFAKNWLEQM